MVIHHNEGDIENGKYTKNFHISRESPFRLPEELEDKLNAFCSQKNSKQGSIDLLVDETESKFYFLEENNFGEYEYLNNNCNYNINEYIAKWIKKILESKKVPVQLNKATYWKAESQPMTDGNQKKSCLL